jgi:hypothetical protein
VIKINNGSFPGCQLAQLILQLLCFAFSVMWQLNFFILRRPVSPLKGLNLSLLLWWWSYWSSNSSSSIAEGEGEQPLLTYYDNIMTANAMSGQLHDMCVMHLGTMWFTRWFKSDRHYLCVNKSQFVPVIFEPPCINQPHTHSAAEKVSSHNVSYLYPSTLTKIYMIKLSHVNSALTLDHVHVSHNVGDIKTDLCYK